MNKQQSKSHYREIRLSPKPTNLEFLWKLIILSALGYACYLFFWQYALNLKNFL